MSESGSVVSSGIGNDGRQGVELQESEAEQLLAGAEYEVDSLSVLELVRDSDCSAYDCEFAALAMRLGTRLATMDAKLLGALPKLAIALQ